MKTKKITFKLLYGRSSRKLTSVVSETSWGPLGGNDVIDTDDFMEPGVAAADAAATAEFVDNGWHWVRWFWSCCCWSVEDVVVGGGRILEVVDLRCFVVIAGTIFAALSQFGRPHLWVFSSFLIL